LLFSLAPPGERAEVRGKVHRIFVVIKLKFSVLLYCSIFVYLHPHPALSLRRERVKTYWRRAG